MRLSSAPHSPRNRGYLLMEVVLALTLFSVAVLGLAHALQVGIGASNELSREAMVRSGMRSYLEEIRYKPTNEMSTSFRDEKVKVTYTSILETVTMKNKDGTVLNDLYQLKITALDNESQSPIDLPLTVLIYKPATSSNSQTAARP